MMSTSRDILIGGSLIIGGITLYYLLQGYRQVCSEGETKCIGSNLYRCINGNWVLVEQNSPQCTSNLPCSDLEGIPGQTPVGYRECDEQNNLCEWNGTKFVLVESNYRYCQTGQKWHKCFKVNNKAMCIPQPGPYESECYLLLDDNVTPTVYGCPCDNNDECKLDPTVMNECYNGKCYPQCTDFLEWAADNSLQDEHWFIKTIPCVSNRLEGTVTLGNMFPMTEGRIKIYLYKPDGSRKKIYDETAIAWTGGNLTFNITETYNPMLVQEILVYVDFPSKSLKEIHLVLRRF